ncbi:hypothetical protein [Neisseria perflava]|uniref:hypothetical protein n=1 Tax=Neisseria perflava TaxID=33053 RepID=UPI0020A206D5|nr:hypothetical protein [Neisseria perflava]MCP1660952.1 hypothetical protein [Neisseria perflava]
MMKYLFFILSVFCVQSAYSSSSDIGKQNCLWGDLHQESGLIQDKCSEKLLGGGANWSNLKYQAESGFTVAVFAQQIFENQPQHYVLRKYPASSNLPAVEYKDVAVSFLDKTLSVTKSANKAWQCFTVPDTIIFCRQYTE